MSARSQALAAMLVCAAPTPGLTAPGSPALSPPPAASAEPTQAELDVAQRRLIGLPTDEHLWRAVLEETAFLGVGGLWYWRHPYRESPDWADLPLPDRLQVESWRFDNNPFETNFAWNALAGSQFHLFARTNEFDLWGSIALGLTSSFMWELIPEYRERISINDLVVTATAGVAVGEFFHWMGRYLESAPQPRGWHRTARWLLSPTRSAHNAVDHARRLRRDTTADNLGFSADIWHRFELSTGAFQAAVGGPDGGDTVATPTLGFLEARGELVAIPGYLRAPHLTRTFSEGNVSSAHVRVNLGDPSFGLDFGASMMMLGRHRQARVGALGAALTVGLGLGIRYRDERFDDWTEQLAQLQLPGLALDYRFRRGPLAVRTRLRLQPELAGIHSLAYPRWLAANPDVTEKSVLSKQGYYYALGGAGAIDTELTWGSWLGIGAALELGRYDSIEGRDPFERWILNDVDVEDRRATWEARLRLTPLDLPFVDVRISGQHRDSSMGEFEASQSLLRYQLGFGTAF